MRGDRIDPKRLFFCIPQKREEVLLYWGNESHRETGKKTPVQQKLLGTEKPLLSNSDRSYDCLTDEGVREHMEGNMWGRAAPQGLLEFFKKCH